MPYVTRLIHRWNHCPYDLVHFSTMNEYTQILSLMFIFYIYFKNLNICMSWDLLEIHPSNFSDAFATGIA